MIMAQMDMMTQSICQSCDKVLWGTGRSLNEMTWKTSEQRRTPLDDKDDDIDTHISISCLIKYLIKVVFLPYGFLSNLAFYTKLE